MRLTAGTVRTITLPPGVPDKVFFDDELPGFGLRVRATGGKTWMVQYAIAGRTRRITLGSTAQLDPGKAREKAKETLAQVRLGSDPAREKQDKREREKETVSALLVRFLERQRIKLKPRSFEETNRHLMQHAQPLHAHPITQLDRRTVAIRLSEIEGASGPAAANRVRGSLSAFCTWAAREGYIDSNPVAFTNKAIENGPRGRLLSDAELAAIWASLGDGQYGTILKLLVLTAARRDEIASLRWSEVDLEAGTITLPPERTKNRREHVIPLSRPALAIIAARRTGAETGADGRDLVFGRGQAGFQDWSGSKADLDARISAARKGRGLDHWTPHDFRRLASTKMNEELSVSHHVVEAILGHVGVKAGIAATYNLALYLDERRRGLERWGDHVIGIVTGKPAKAKVVSLRKR
jgi:integrase